MARTYTTLEYGGQEKTLADWGTAEEGMILTLSDQPYRSPDTLRLIVPNKDALDDPIWPFEGAIVLRSGRAKKGLGFEGGLIEFAGKRMLHVIDMRPEFEGVSYNFAGPGYDIQNCAYQQPAAYWLPGIPTDGPGLGLSSSVVLFAKLVAGMLTWVTTKQQIFDALQHLLDQYAAQGMAVPFQLDLGLIDVNVPVVFYPMQDVKVSEVIEYCLRPSPDARLWFDYAVQPPMVHVTSRKNCVPVTWAIGDGVQSESLRITPRPDLQARSVVIYFLVTISVTDPNPPHQQLTYVRRLKQKYGPHGADSDLDPDGGLRVVVGTLDMQGVQKNDVYGTLTTQMVTNDLAFWSVVLPELGSTQIRAFTALSGLTVKDDSGNVVSLASYPNALMDGSALCPWMTLNDGTPITGQQVTIIADVSYKLYDVEATGGDRTATNGNVLEIFPKKQLSWRGVITNGVSGEYTATASMVSGQPIPNDLAQHIYESLAELQHEGDKAIVCREVSGGVSMGNVLNLSGGRAEWLTMRAQIQSIVKDFGTGRVAVRIGPAQDLCAGDLTRIFETTRYRHVYTNPLVKQTGQPGELGVTLGKNAVKENSNVGLAAREFLRLLYTQT